jgi:PiT family inorganic phosphate transporter
MHILEQYSIIFISITVVVGLFQAWNIGANDVANAMGTSVGSEAISFKQAIIIAGIFEFLGVVIAGGSVTTTIKNGIVSPDLFTNTPEIFVYGMISSLLAASIWLFIATFSGQPVSTTHSIVGAIMGFAIVAVGWGSISWDKVSMIVASWVISPLMGGILAFLVFLYIRKYILNSETPLVSLRKHTPYILFFSSFILTILLFKKGLKNLHLDNSTYMVLIYSVITGIIIFAVSRYFLNKMVIDNEVYYKKIIKVEKIFGYFQIATAAFVAFAHGSNDVANAVGPMAAVIDTIKGGVSGAKAPLPTWVLLSGGVFIVIGLATYGYKVIKTVGSKITEITPTRGFSAEIGAAATIIVASTLGLPISTTHVLIGAVIGIGFARGVSGLNLSVLKKIVASWVITLPVSAFLSGVIFYIFKSIFS